VVDEARHSYFFARFYHHVLGVPGGLREALATLGVGDGSRDGDADDGYDRIFDPRRGELVTLTDAVRLEPRNYGRWVQAITIYHLMVEGILALTGQRRVLRLLRNMDLLPAFRAGFTAVTRDESRHVSYGVWALRQAVAAGHEADIRTVVDRTFEPCLRVYANPDFRLPDPRELPPQARQDPRDTWAFALDAVTKRLRSAGADAGWVAVLEQRGRVLLAELLTAYERRHGEHPVRVWERGEVQAAASR
jgi:ribonucleoside-diphosphate reductase beta chain